MVLTSIDAIRTILHSINRRSSSLQCVVLTRDAIVPAPVYAHRYQVRCKHASKCRQHGRCRQRSALSRKADCLRRIYNDCCLCACLVVVIVVVVQSYRIHKLVSFMSTQQDADDESWASRCSTCVCRDLVFVFASMVCRTENKCVFDVWHFPCELRYIEHEIIVNLWFLFS